MNQDRPPFDHDQGASTGSTWQRPGPRPYPRGVLPILAVALVVSLLTNLLLVSRLEDERADVAALRRSVAEQQAALDTLRGDVRGTSDDPLVQISAAVERIRSLSFRERIEPELLTSAQLAARVRGSFRDDNDRAEFEANQQVLEVLGLIAPGTDLWSLIQAANEEQIGGFYDSDKGVMVVEARDATKLGSLDRFVLAHEFTHAVTDQHFDLSRLDDLQEKRADDEAFAYLSLVEGDAQLVSELYVGSVLTQDEQLELLREAEGISTTRFDALPEYLREVYEFPYRSGVDFVRALHRQGGFATVNGAYRDPPVSTEQIMHPNRYIATRDDPVAVRLPDLRARLGGGWRRIDGGGIGELDMLLIADHGAQSITRTDARRAAAGWDGGAYVGLRSGDDVLVAMLTAWDSQAEAREAVALFERWLPLRFANVGSAFDAGSNAKGWESPDGAGIVARDGDHMVLLVGPSRGSVERAAAAFSSN